MARRSIEYKFRGRALAAGGPTLGDALGALADLWGDQPSLSMHEWGAVRIEIVVAGTATTFEVTDPDILDEVSRGNLDPLLKHLAGEAGISVEDLALLLVHAEDVETSVDRIRPPSSPNFWKPDPGLDPSVLKGTVYEWAAEVASAQRRDAGTAPLGPEAQKMIEVLLRAAEARDLTLQDVARDTGIPISTLRDAQAAGEAPAPTPGAAPPAVLRSLRKRKRGKRLTELERRAVAAVYQRTGNAAAVQRELGVPARTVREIVARTAVSAPPVTPLAPEARREEVRRLVREEGITASEAGRRLGVPERTARGWASSAATQQIRAPAAAQAPPTPAPATPALPSRDELRRELVDLVASEGISASEAGRRLGVPDRTARSWVRKSRS